MTYVTRYPELVNEAVGKNISPEKIFAKHVTLSDGTIKLSYPLVKPGFVVTHDGIESDGGRAAAAKAYATKFHESNAVLNAITDALDGVINGIIG